MLTDARGFSGFAVRDVDTARSFYRDVLGLEVGDPGMGLLSLRLPQGPEVLVYPKPDHVPATYTILNFSVGDIDATVSALAEHGVTFVHYEGFEQDDLGIARGDGEHGRDIALFTDPSGNCLSVLAE